jgi:hypothetical protein
MSVALNSSEILGALFKGVKNGKISNTTSSTDSAAAVAGWIVANVYDVERFKGENRTVLISAIAQAMAHYKGDI